jgi:predicted Zn-dependent protease
MKPVKYLLIVLLFAALVSSCESISVGSLIDAVARNADSISSTFDAVTRSKEEISAEEEYYIGRAVAANITTSYKPYTTNESLSLYLNEICRTIAINSDRPDLFNGYYLMILDTEEVNAFASSGGHVFITKGLLRSANSEDALAGIIAHEIAHIQLQHSVQAIKASRTTDAWTSVATTTAGVALTATGNSTADMLADLVNMLDSDIKGAISNLVEKGYSRDQEYQADDLALELLAATGYEPASYIEMLRGLSARQAAVSGGFNSTHPSPDARITNAEKSIGKYTVVDTRGSRIARFQDFTRNI